MLVTVVGRPEGVTSTEAGELAASPALAKPDQGPPSRGH
jgi:hypothetical protein